MEYRYQIWQGGIMVAEVGGTILPVVQSEARHYAAKYLEEGPIEIKVRLGFWRATCGDYIEIGLWFGRVIYSWQTSEWMACSGPYKESAPKIIWKHSLDTANFRARERALLEQ